MRGAGSQAPGMIEGALRNGPMSTMVRGLGAGAEEGGSIAAKISKPFIAEGIPRDVLTSQMPVAGPVQGVGLALQAPGGLARLMAKAYAKFGGKSGEKFAQNVGQDAAGNMPIGNIFQEAGETLARKTPLGQEGVAAYRAARKAGSTAEEAIAGARAPRVAAYGEKGRKLGNAF